MPLVIDGIRYYGGDDDDEFLLIAQKMENCFYLGVYGDCEKCVHCDRCMRLFNGLSERASHHRLTQGDVEYYQNRYQKLLGIMI